MPDLAAHQQRLLDVAIDTGYGRWAGVQLLEIGDGIGRIGFTIRDEMRTPWGSLNGGVITSLIEIPGFVALLTGLGEGELPVTNDIFVQHMRPLPGDARYALAGRVIRRGKSMAWLDVTVTAGDTTVSVARITKTLIRQG